MEGVGIQNCEEVCNEHLQEKREEKVGDKVAARADFFLRNSWRFWVTVRRAAGHEFRGENGGGGGMAAHIWGLLLVQTLWKRSLQNERSQYVGFFGTLRRGFFFGFNFFSSLSSQRWRWWIVKCAKEVTCGCFSSGIIFFLSLKKICKSVLTSEGFCFYKDISSGFLWRWFTHGQGSFKDFLMYILRAGWPLISEPTCFQSIEWNHFYI